MNMNINDDENEKQNNKKIIKTNIKTSHISISSHFYFKKDLTLNKYHSLITTALFLFQMK
jgi:hypothetical protein